MEFNLADLFEIAVDAVPERTALIAGDERRTYHELNDRANRLAHHLLDPNSGLALKTGEAVAIYSWNRAEWLEAEIAIYKARGVVININYRYVIEELRYMLENSDAVAVIFERAFAPLLAEIYQDCPKVRHFIAIDDKSSDSAAEIATALTALKAKTYEAVMADASPEQDFAPRSADDRYILYTGGTTGLPKGVIWRQEDIFFAALGGGGFNQPPIVKPEELRERILAAEPIVDVINAPMMHGGGQWTTFINFFRGSCIALNCDHHFSAERILRLAEREKAFSIMIVGDAMARPIADAIADPTTHYDLSNLFLIGSGGAIMSRAVKEQLRALVPGVIVSDSFGASETGAAGTVMDFDGPAAGPRFTVSEKINVLNEKLLPVKPGSGEVGLLARSGNIPLGYYKDEAKTAATFVIDPDGMRWVVPGDYATIEDDGTLNLLGRGSACINTGGEKIYVEEVEAVLKAHPDIFDAVVVGVPDERFGERVAAIVTTRNNTPVDLIEVQEFCSSSLARYKLPREIHLTEEIPRTAVGKPDYRWAKRIATG